MDRIHRLGQHRPVQAIKLVIEDSIESRIVQVRCHRSHIGLSGLPTRSLFLASGEEIGHGGCDAVNG